jgi:hypothetical protein
MSRRDREHHESSHLKELALPVLEHGFDEMSAREVAREIDGPLAVHPELVVVGREPGHSLPDEQEEEEAPKSTRDRPLS